MPQPLPEVVSVPQAAERLGIPTPTLYRYIGRNLIPHIRTRRGTESGIVLTRNHVQEIAGALVTDGRRGILDGQLAPVS